MKIKKIIRPLAFLIILFLLFMYLSFVFTFPRDQKSDMARERFNTYYALPKNSVDALFIGSSAVDRYWMSQLAWKENGIATFALSSGNQPTGFVKYLIEEVSKRHDPKVIVIDIRPLLRKPSGINDTDIRRVTDNLRPSINRIKATNAILDYVDQVDADIDTSDWSYYINLIKYHSAWNTTKLTDYLHLFPRCDYMGFFAYNKNAFKIEPQEKTHYTDATLTINPNSEALFLDLLEYCKTLDSEVVFIAAPHSVDDIDLKQTNYVLNLAKDAGFNTINMNTPKIYRELGWDFNHDMYNPGHANIYGAVKYTRWMSNYLMDNYGLEDMRSEDNSKYKIWEDSYEATMSRLYEFDPDYYESIYIK